LTSSNKEIKEKQKSLLKQKTFLESLTSRYRIVTILIAGFALLIALGSLLLWLPISVQRPGESYLTHLFVATSAVCVTGLSPVTVADTYTMFGRTVLLVLMQVGGLGLMTFVALVLNMGQRKASFRELRALADAAGKHGYDDIGGYLKRIVLYTIGFEFLGFLLLGIRFASEFDPAEGLFHALFVSVAAFTNAGFDSFSSESLAGYATDPLVSLTVMMLIIVGGLGFMVWIELRNHMRNMRERHLPLRCLFSSFSVHTKVVSTATLFLLLVGMILFLLTEWTNPNTIGEFGLGDKLLVSAFQSTTLRTAGFSTVSIAALNRVTRLYMCLFMLIGGSPGGTAGGMKTTTFIAIVMMLRSGLRDEAGNCHLFHRRISRSDFVKAEMILTGYLAFILIGVSILLMTEPGIEALNIVYEAVSALATVGLSANVTPILSSVGRVVIIVMMFAGRVGPLAVIEAFQRKSIAPIHEHVRYPDADILIG